MTGVLAEVRESMWHYPTLHPNRTMALLSMLTYSGAYWKNGELFRDDPPPREERHFEDPEEAYQHRLAEETIWDSEKKERVPDPDISDSTREMLRRLSAEDAAITAEVRQNIDEKIRTPGLLKLVSWISDHMPIANIPDDITDEWREAVIEVCEAILQCDRAGYLPEPSDEPPSRETSEAMFMLLGDILAEAEGKKKPSAMTPEELDAHRAEVRSEQEERVRREIETIAEHKKFARETIAKLRS